MKKFLLTFITLVSLMIMTVSCEGDLDIIDPSALNADQFIVDAATAKQTLFQAYNDIQDRYVASAEPIMFQGLYTDDFIHTGSFPHLDEVLFNNIFTDNNGVTAIFSEHYDIINTTTEVIRLTAELDIDVIEDIEKAEIIAEAHALRAYAYFNLVRFYGGLPITENTVALDGSSANSTPRSTESEVYAYILNEIALAEGNLPDNPYTRFSNYAVQVLKAQVQLTLGNYNEAENILTPLIGGFSLVSYNTLFGFNSGDNESAIFTVNYNAADGNSLNLFFTSGGRREVAPSQSLLDAFEVGDIRKTKIAANTNVETSFINKYLGASAKPYVYRYADVLLMYAEVLARRNDPTAITYIDEVRTRAGLPSIGTFDSSNVVSAIAQERRVEFYGEPHRWYDVKRLGLSQQVIESKGVNFQTKQLLWPIPQNEINSNPAMSQSDQNPGY